jgi:hypothetical protein
VERGTFKIDVDTKELAIDSFKQMYQSGDASVELEEPSFSFDTLSFTYMSTYGAPVLGSLIRSSCSMGFVSLVTKVGPHLEAMDGSPYMMVEAVRYAKINNGERILLKGSRVRPFKWLLNSEMWHIVKECVYAPSHSVMYTKESYDNEEDIADHLKSIEGVNLHYTAPITDTDTDEDGACSTLLS